MIHDPSVLILDEPANGLDPRARIELREMIRQLAAEGKTVLVSSHILTELAEMCDEVGIIERGQLLAVGSVSEIQRQANDSGPHREVKVCVLGGAASIGGWLAARDGFREIKIDGDTARFTHPGDQAAEVALLRDLVLAGFPVVEFGSHSQSLEDVFMAVTRGAVQ
jgi:ABC-2 type transport system ATP-binding protein